MGSVEFLQQRKSSWPLVSVVIVNYNGKKYITSCVRATLGGTYENIEVIVCDNGSTDGSIEELKRDYSSDRRLRIISIGENKGPAYARNLGISRASGKYIAFLDNDTEPEPDWLFSLVDAMEEDTTIGACQCKLLLMTERNRIDYAGDYISNLGFLIQRIAAGEIDTGQADTREEILSAKSAAMIIRADVARQIDGFDSDYFIYLEETDLGWRTWLKGYRIIFIPESRVYHAFGTSQIILGKKQNELVKFHGTKNYITTLIKNLEARNIFRILPVHLSLWCGIATFSALKGRFTEARDVSRGIFWVFLNLPSILKKRRRIQKMRVVTDCELLPKIIRKRSFSYYYNKLVSVHKIGNAEGFFRQGN